MNEYVIVMERSVTSGDTVITEKITLSGEELNILWTKFDECTDLLGFKNAS